MKLWPRLYGDRRAREKWEAGLLWFRMRYREPAGPTNCLKLLSRSAACGRIALYYQPGTVSRLYLGIPKTHVRLLRRMVEDFGFLLKPMPPRASVPPIRRLTTVSEISWNRPFVSHVVGETLYVDLVDDESNRGAFLPQPRAKPQMADWQLLTTPPPGLTTVPSRNGQEPPAHLVAPEPDSRKWLLGRSWSGHPLQVPGRINIYGRQEAVADWLIQQVTQMITIDSANLLVIDGSGDLVSQLKRKTTITRLLGDQLAYIDMDSVSLTNGFNPLAPVPGETEEALVERWQRWFRGMNVHPLGVNLLALARQEGVEDIPGLRKWLKKVERHGQFTAFSSMNLALNRMAANRALREWFEWPANVYEMLPEGALLFACKATGWARRQLLRCVLLAALNMVEGRLILLGIPWQQADISLLRQHQQLVVGNGPLMPENTVLLVESQTQTATRLASKFLKDDPVFGENLQLLKQGEGIVITQESAVCYVSWNNHSRDGSADLSARVERNKTMSEDDKNHQNKRSNSS